MQAVRKKHDDVQVPGRLNLRVEPELHRLALELVRERGARDLSDYIRGLLIDDAMEAEKQLRGVSIPGWLTDRRLILVRRDSEAHVPSPGAPSSISSKRSRKVHET